jgi:nitrate reductase assembly molybdenum cofactor insertion protein NarJ
MRTLKILGFLMTYPQAQHQEVANECAALLESEKWLSDKTLSSLKPFFQNAGTERSS